MHGLELASLEIFRTVAVEGSVTKAALSVWGPCSDCGDCAADFDGDCHVGITDLLLLLGNWR